MKRASIGLVVLLALLAGCASQQWSRHEMTIQLAVRAATGRILHENPTWVERCYEITANGIRFVDAQTIVNVEELQAWVMGEIPWEKVLPEERALLEMTIEVVAKEIRWYLADVPAQEQAVRVIAVLTWINQTAEYRLPK